MEIKNKKNMIIIGVLLIILIILVGISLYNSSQKSTDINSINPELPPEEFIPEGMSEEINTNL